MNPNEHDGRRDIVVVGGSARTMEESIALGQRLIGAARREGNTRRALDLNRGIEGLERDAERVRTILYDRQG